MTDRQKFFDDIMGGSPGEGFAVLAEHDPDSLHAFQQFTSFLYGRPDELIPRRQRELLVIGVLAARGSLKQLRLHIRGALEGGISAAEVLQTLELSAAGGGLQALTDGAVVLKEEVDAVGISFDDRGSPAANKRAFRMVVEEIVNTGNVDLADELIDEDFLIHRTGLQTSATVVFGDQAPPVAADQSSSREGFKRGLLAIRSSFPDWTHTIDWVFAEDDWVAGTWRLTATHTGESFFGLPPSGREVAMVEAGVMRFDRGRLAEGWYLGDELNFLHMLAGVQLVGPSLT